MMKMMTSLKLPRKRGSTLKRVKSVPEGSKFQRSSFGTYKVDMYPSSQTSNLSSFKSSGVESSEVVQYSSEMENLEVVYLSVLMK